MRVHIIGGGVIGLCTAYYLNQAGVDVTIIDKGDFSDNCSYGNSGIITPSHFIPLAAPGVIQKGLRWMFNAASPFYIRPSLNPDLIKWLWSFYKSCNQDHVDNSKLILKEINEKSRDLYASLANNQDFKRFSKLEEGFGFEQKGLLMLFQSPEAKKEELELAEMANEIGIQADFKTAVELGKMNPDVQMHVDGGVYYPGDAHLYPNQFMDQMKSYLLSKSIQFESQQKVIGFNQKGGKINEIVCKTKTFNAEQVIICTGARSGRLAKVLTKSVLIQDGKGYSMTIKNAKQKPSIPIILTEEKVAVTNMCKDLRIGGTLEISQLSPKIQKKRVDGIIAAAQSYFPSLEMNEKIKADVWYGYRPCSPDGLPYIGKIDAVDNCYINSGHAMMGMSLGPFSGKLITELMLNQKPRVPIDLFSPSRF